LPLSFLLSLPLSLSLSHAHHATHFLSRSRPTGDASTRLQDYHSLTGLSTTAATLSALNLILQRDYKFTYTDSSTNSGSGATSSSSSSSSASGGGGSSSITALHIDEPAGKITDANLEAVKALLNHHIGAYMPSGRSALGASFSAH
jgi:hypothetical protein